MLTPEAILDQSGEGLVTPLPRPERWWHSFFESSEDAQVVCRADGLVVKINHKAARLLKLDRGATEGRFSIFDVLLPPAGPKLREALRHGQARSDTLHSVVILTGGR